MLLGLSNILNKNIFDIENSISTLDNMTLVATNQEDMVKYQYILVEIDNKITNINTLISTMDTFTSTISSILDIISLLPIPTAPFPITVGLIMKVSDKQQVLKRLLDNIVAYLSVIKPLVTSYSTTIESLGNTYNQVDENYQFVANNSSQSLYQSKPIENYKNLNIYIKEDTSGSFIKHFGVAKNNDNIEIVRTDSSHVTNTQLLVDKVKLLIDKYY